MSSSYRLNLEDEGYVEIPDLLMNATGALVIIQDALAGRPPTYVRLTPAELRRLALRFLEKAEELDAIARIEVEAD